MSLVASVFQGFSESSETVWQNMRKIACGFAQKEDEMSQVTQVTKQRLYKTETTLKRQLRVSYPAGNGKLVLRTEQDWDKTIEPVSTSEDGNTSTFELEADQPFLYFKACLVRDDGLHWSVGQNKLMLMEESDKRISYPSFFSSEKGNFSELVEFPSQILGRVHRIRAYVPPGYYENTLAYYPVAFMQDGQNLFFLKKLSWVVIGMLMPPETRSPR